MLLPQGETRASLVPAPTPGRNSYSNLNPNQLYMALSVVEAKAQVYEIPVSTPHLSSFSNYFRASFILVLAVAPSLHLHTHPPKRFWAFPQGNFSGQPSPKTHPPS